MSASLNNSERMPGIVPLSLRDAPSLIERMWPAQKISVETQKERKAVKGQTLTGLGSYWKGRKPLFLVRACVLGALLPSTGNDEQDLALFEALCGISDDQVRIRLKTFLTVSQVSELGTPDEISALLETRSDGSLVFKNIPKEHRSDLMSTIVARMPYQKRADLLVRPEEVCETSLTNRFMVMANAALGTSATSLQMLIEQLGIMRFGAKPRIGDVFSGGGSIPFEAARLGCDVYASDLNPLACLLTWGALHVIGATAERRNAVACAEEGLIKLINRDLDDLGFEYDSEGNKAKAYLYCSQARCPQSGWVVPMSPSWIISKSKRVIAALVPDFSNKKYDIEVRSNVGDDEFALASKGTIQGGQLVHKVGDVVFSTSIKAIRGDRKGPSGDTITDLRRWEKSDFEARPEDVFQERLYAIQWIPRSDLAKARPAVFFTSVRPQDEARELAVRAYVKQNLSTWQDEGLVPDMPIERGTETARLIRERGWTYWHHVFTPRDYVIISSLLRHNKEPEIEVLIPSLLNHASKLCQWATTNAPLDENGKQAGGARDLPNHVFYNQAFNTFWNYASRASSFLLRDVQVSKEVSTEIITGTGIIKNIPADQLSTRADIFITDPPYADAVNYHEISEFFIAWLRKRPSSEFKDWTWDSRRPLAIAGNGEAFKSNMILAYKAMAQHMPDNGLQIVMFTHQSASVWGDMAQIFWGAGLQVMAAWYIATETTSELKKGGYVQGTVILVLRKRKSEESGYKDEIVQEVRAEVADQIDTMMGLNQSLKGCGRIESLFEDADLQMAGYAAALRVLTRYQRIDGTDMAKEALRQRRPGEKNLVGDVIEFAVQVANEHMVPERMPTMVWERLTGPERFYFKMMDIETTNSRKLDNYQNFAKAFRVGDYALLMGSMEPNKASLKSARQFRRSGFEMPEFGSTATRAALYALYELENDVEGDDVLAHLRDLLPSSYHSKRDELMAIADYVAHKRSGIDENEARAARILYDLIRNERLG